VNKAITKFVRLCLHVFGSATKQNDMQDSNGMLTPQGRHMARLPVEPPHAAFLLEAARTGCAADAAALVGMLSADRIFVAPASECGVPVGLHVFVSGSLTRSACGASKQLSIRQPIGKHAHVPCVPYSVHHVQ
jgi:HrpA-like RNA helicase